MPDKKSKEKKSGDDADEDAGKSGGKGKLLPAIVLSVGLLGAGYFLGGGGGGGSAAAPVAEASTEVVEEEEEHHELGTLISLDAINVNLSDGHFLRIAVTLELSEEKSEYVAAKTKKDKTYAFPSAPAADMVLAVFSGRVMSDLQTPEGRDAARIALEEAVHGVYGDDVVHIYLTEFVMQ